MTTILKQKFLEQIYSVFDTTNSRVGFASAICWVKTSKGRLKFDDVTLKNHVSHFFNRGMC